MRVDATLVLCVAVLLGLIGQAAITENNNGFYIGVYDDSVSRDWFEAKHYCMAVHGSSLASMHDATDWANMLDARVNTPAVWIGANDIASPGSFVYSDGSGAGYIGWNVGEPNGGNEYCVHTWADGTANDLGCNGKWHDLVCNLPQEWRPVFKLSKGSSFKDGLSYHDDYYRDGTPSFASYAEEIAFLSSFDPAAIDTTTNFRSRILDEWGALSGDFTKVAMKLYSGGALDSFWIYNNAGDRENWMSAAQYVDSSYADVSYESALIWSLDGNSDHGRRFSVIQGHYGCPNDRLWFTVVSGGVSNCGANWNPVEGATDPQMRVSIGQMGGARAGSGRTSVVQSNPGQNLEADTMVIMVNTRVAFNNNGFYIGVHDPSVARNWFQAQDYCAERLDASLASMQNAGDWANMLDAQVNPDAWVWIGANDIASEGSFEYSDGSGAGYIPWGPGEPNNYGDEDCVKEHDSEGRAYDAACTDTSHDFVCNLPISTTRSPTRAPSVPTMEPSEPTGQPSQPTLGPTGEPTYDPTLTPTDETQEPTRGPSDWPTDSPSHMPTSSPSESPSVAPSGAPSAAPSKTPSATPTQTPSDAPSDGPSDAPTTQPTNAPSGPPTLAPTSPSNQPTRNPTYDPTEHPTYPTRGPSLPPTRSPTYELCDLDDLTFDWDDVNSGAATVDTSIATSETVESGQFAMTVTVHAPYYVAATYEVYEDLYKSVTANGRLGATYVLATEEFTTEGRQLSDAGVCENRAAASYAGKHFLNNFWDYSLKPSDPSKLGNDVFLEYPDANVWQLSMVDALSDPCGTIQWTNTFSFDELRSCEGFAFLDDGTHLKLEGDIYLVLVSPNPLYLQSCDSGATDCGQYLTRTLESHPVRVQFTKQQSAVTTSEGISIDLFTSNIIGASYNETKQYFELTLLTTVPNFMSLDIASAVLVSPTEADLESLNGGDDFISGMSILEQTDSYGFSGDCLIANEYRCFQKFLVRVEVQDCSTPRDFDGDYYFSSNFDCRDMDGSGTIETDEQQVCDDYLSEEPTSVTLDAAALSYREGCDSSLYDIPWEGTLEFYPEDFSAPLASQVYAFGDTVYLRAQVDGVADYSVVGMEIVELYLCTADLPSESDPLPADGCLDASVVDQELFYMMDDSDVAYTPINGALSDSFKEFSVVLPVVADDRFFVHVVIELSIVDETRRRVLLSSGGISNRFGSLFGSAGAANKDEKKDGKKNNDDDDDILTSDKNIVYWSVAAAVLFLGSVATAAFFFRRSRIAKHDADMEDMQCTIEFN